MKWYCKYINLPYDNHNCFEFIVMVVNKEFGFNVPNLIRYEKNVDGMNEQILKHQFDYVEKEPVKPKTGDIVLMSANRELNHVGLYVEENGISYCLHCMKNFNKSIMHKIKDLPNYNLRVKGFYRWLK